jgi:hypothetical protein
MKKVTFYIEPPEECTDKEFQEWIEYELKYDRINISVENPLCSYYLEAKSIEIENLSDDNQLFKERVMEKLVIKATSLDGSNIYLTKNKQKYWSDDIKDARIFTSQDAAYKVLCFLRYNEPYVINLSDALNLNNESYPIDDDRDCLIGR